MADSSKLMLPWRGVSDVAPYIEMPGDLAAPGDPLNVIPRRRAAVNGSGGRRQIASRPGTVLAFPQTLAGKPQCAGNVSKATGITGYTSGEPVTLSTGLSVPQTPYRTQLVVLDTNWSIKFVLNDTRAALPITSISAAAAAVVTTSIPHGYSTGNTVVIAGSNCTPSIDGTRTVTVLTPTTFSVAVTTSSAGTTGTSQVIPPSGAGGPGGFYTCWHRTDPTVGYFGTLTKDPTVTTQDVWICGLNRFSVTTQAITHQNYVVDAAPGYSTPLGASPTQESLFPNEVVQFGPYVFVAVNRYIYVFDAGTLVYLYRTTVPWAVEVQSVQPLEVNGRHFLLALISGSVVITGPVVNDTSGTNKEAFGEHFRAGIVVFEILYANSTSGFPYAEAPATPVAVAVGGQALVHRSVPQGTQVGDASHEAHQTYRFSEWSSTRPVGRLSYDFAVASNGDVYIGSCNQGFGYDPLTNPSQAPNGPTNTSTLNAYISVAKHRLTRAFEPDAPIVGTQLPVVVYLNPSNAVRYGCSSTVGGWERDVPNGSYRRTFAWGASTYRADIPPITNGSRDPANEDYAPTVYAVAYNEAVDRVVVAGRRPSVDNERPNVYCLEGATGIAKWTTGVSGLVQQNAIAIDPTSGNVVVAGNRNASWPRPDGETLTINQISAAASARVTTDTPHGLQTGDVVQIGGTNSTPSINGMRTVTYVSANEFDVPVTTSVSGNAGYAKKGAYAEVWEIDIGNGAIVRWWDFSSAVNVNGYLIDGYATMGAYDVDVSSTGLVMVALAPYRHDT